MPCGASMPLARCQGTVHKGQLGGIHKRIGLSFKAAITVQPVEDRLGSHKAAAPSGHCHGVSIDRRSAVQVKAQLFRPPVFDPKKLSTTFLPGCSESGPLPPAPRCYTLTHNDLTGQLSLSIGSSYNALQVSGWYTRLIRDEVLAEWRFGAEGEPSLHVHCHVSGEERWLAPPALRNYIFQREMPLVLETVLHADRLLLSRLPWLASATVVVHLSSHVKELHMTLQWGMLTQRSTWRTGCHLSTPFTNWWRPPYVAGSVDRAEPLTAIDTAAPAGVGMDEGVILPASCSPETAQSQAVTEAYAAAANQQLLDELGTPDLLAQPSSDELIQAVDGQSLPGPGSLDGLLSERAASRASFSCLDSLFDSVLLPGQSSHARGEEGTPLFVDNSQQALLLDSQSTEEGDSAGASTPSVQQLSSESAISCGEHSLADIPSVSESPVDRLTASSTDHLSEDSGELPEDRESEQRGRPDSNGATERVSISSGCGTGSLSANDGEARFLSCARETNDCNDSNMTTSARGFAEAAELDVRLPMQFSAAQSCQDRFSAAQCSSQDRSRWEVDAITVRSIVSEWLASGHEVITVRR